MKVMGIVGWKNSGKTTLVERLVAELTGRGHRVSTMKHAHHHKFQVDNPGKDSDRHRTAGAEEVLVTSSARWALIGELRGAAEPSMEEHLARMSPVDLVLVEGFKASTHPKIEAFRKENDKPLLAEGDDTVIAVASDGTIDGLELPRFDLNDVAAIADFIEAQTGLTVPDTTDSAAE